MKLNVNNQDFTPKDFSRYVLCKVIEDLDTKFDEYATAVWQNYSALTEVEKAKINDWKHKEIVKVYKFLSKDDFNANNKT